jgi:hypothetical protein
MAELSPPKSSSPEARPVARAAFRSRFNLELLAILVTLLANLILVAPKLMPTNAQVNPDDEAKYVESGRLLLTGSIRDISWGPLVSLVYAPIHLVVGNSPDWFLIEVWVARFILFAFPWLGIYVLTRQFRNFAPPLVAAGVLFVATPFALIAKNQSDSLFLGFSALALAKLIEYYRERRMRDVGLASLFVGLGVLCRVETIVLVGSLTLIALVITARAPNFRKNVGKILLAAVLPAAGVLALYVTACLAVNGSFALSGIASKSYLAFESNQPHTVIDTPEARAESARLYGTRAENNGSVIQAILHNPGAFLQRVIDNAKTIPALYSGLFGQRLGLLLLFFSAWGTYWLIKKGAAPLLIILLVWALHALIPLAFLILHIVPQSSFLPLLLGAVGFAASFDPALKKGERIALLLAAALLTLAGGISKNSSLLGSGALITAGLAIDWLARSRIQSQVRARQASLLLMVVIGLILHGPYKLTTTFAVDQSNEEQAIRYLEQTLPQGSKVLVPTGRQAIASKMTRVDPASLPDHMNSTQDVWDWLKRHRVQAVYADSHFEPRPEIDRLIRAGEGQYFDDVFTTADGNLTIYRVRQ